MSINCPKCETELHVDIAGAVGKKQKFCMTLHPEPGSMMQAKTVGGQMTAMDDLMRACCKEDGAKVATYIERIDTDETGAIHIHYVVLPLVEWDDRKGKFVRKQPPAALDDQGKGLAEGTPA